MSGQIILSVEDQIATLTLDHPGKLNGVSLDMWQQLQAHCVWLSSQPDLRCVVIRGAHGHFAAGGDLAEFPFVRNTLEQIAAYHIEAVAPALAALAACIHPVVALIEGVCMGGGLEIAAQCDIRIGGRSSRLGAPILRLGFAMAPHEIQSLLPHFGHAVMAELLLEGRIYDADEAYAKGLLTRVVEDADVGKEAYASAQRIARGAPLAARANKQMLRRLLHDTSVLRPEEIQAHLSLWAESADHREGVAAFLEKRTPNFCGR